MKIVLFLIIPITLVILADCSGDRVVNEQMNAVNDVSNTTYMTAAPQPHYPPVYGDNEYTPPYLIVVSFNAVPNVTGNHCEVLLAAIPMDLYAHPYRDTTLQINFEIFPESLATINHTVYTNEYGSALNRLVYPTWNAGQEIGLVVSSGPYVDTLTISLPIGGAQLWPVADPARLWVEHSGQYDTSSISCQLTDGAGNGIRNGKILFIALVAGEICGPQWDYTDDRGYVYTEYRIGYEEIPDGNNDPSSILTGVRAVLFGYPDVEAETSLFCARP